MGLAAAKTTESRISTGEVVQLVVDQMSLDPAGQLGKNAMKQKIALETGYHLRR